jgi:heat shock protein beta
LKDDAAEYVEQEKIKNLVKKYSEFINYPIKLYLSKDVREQVPVEEEKPKDEVVFEGDEESEEKKDGETEVTDEEEKDKADEKEPKTKTVTKTVWDWEPLNEIKAIWMREKSDITERGYNDFYKSISKDT